MAYKDLKYVHDLAFGRQSRKSSVEVWHIPDSYNFVCGYNVPLGYLLYRMDSENLKALFYDLKPVLCLHSNPIYKLHN